jgi:hypothetical protein
MASIKNTKQLRRVETIPPMRKMTPTMMRMTRKMRKMPRRKI